MKQLDIYIRSLDRDFRLKSEKARDACVRRFVKAHRLSIRCGTHVAQQDPLKTQELALDFLRSVRPRFSTLPDRSLILNMDQTPIFFHVAQAHARSGRLKNSQHSNVLCEHFTSYCCRYRICRRSRS